MKGVTVVVALFVALLAYLSIGLANEPIVPPVQYEQFCDNQKVAGTGIIDVGTSIVDKKIALDYSNFMAGDGDIELDQVHAYSQNADKLKRNVSSVNDGNESNFNLYENQKLTYRGETPLVGEKSLKSKEFYGGIGARIEEKFSVNEMEKDQTTFFTSTAPSTSTKQTNPQPILIPIMRGHLDALSKPKVLIYPVMVYNPPSIKTTIASEQIVEGLKNAGSDETKVNELMGSNPTHTLGIETKNSFNGTWGTDSTWHKIFYKDIKDSAMFTGQFEAEKTIKFHENPVPEKSDLDCAGIDC